MKRDLRPITLRTMTTDDLSGVVALQRDCFPPPFPEDHLWSVEHLTEHVARFPEGQWVALHHGSVIGSASSARISEATWQARLPWEQTLGGWDLRGHDPDGNTLYGADISVHPNFRGEGVGRALYAARFELVCTLNLTRFGTACRIPGCQASGLSPRAYVADVVAGSRLDRTLTPLLRYGLSALDTLENYMEDEESQHAAALLEWKP